MTSLHGRRVQIAGAGVLGLSIAVILADAGATVTVFDPEPEGRASAVAAGMLAPVFETLLDPVSEGHFDLLMAARDLWPAFGARCGIAVHRCGAIYNGDRFAAAKAFLASRGLSSDLGSGGLFTPDDWRIDAAPALHRLRALASKLGVEFHAERLVTNDPGSDTVAATGHMAISWAPESAIISAIKGQLLQATSGPLSRLDSGPVERRDGGYISPGSAGALIGATMQPGFSDLRPDGAIAAIVPGVFPELQAAGFEGEVKVGIRGATPDGLPLVGPGAKSNVWLAMGARRNGWLLAPLVASMIRAYLAGDDPGPWAEMLDARRFTAPALEE